MKRYLASVDTFKLKHPKKISYLHFLSSIVRYHHIISNINFRRSTFINELQIEIAVLSMQRKACAQARADLAACKLGFLYIKEFVNSKTVL